MTENHLSGSLGVSLPSLESVAMLLLGAVVLYLVRRGMPLVGEAWSNRFRRDASQQWPPTRYFRPEFDLRINEPIRDRAGPAKLAENSGQTSSTTA